ncbi:TraR/DksA C4-type zinc finger protein [Roseinatronobacter sp. S2]|uniref:TraR/DksA family transcriptional regulator n=1 Tax=Roseinatronobacter sp. S2 TaxID=3035471 RepID=UPI00240FA078|nr:TraR/DksA C4-type zinc finger protein [Roseinatronobacter sp. S2]WFE75327.1 TraR/DksA C4-type zinc finger protein [Roseinatronobacter sp. S2]
MNEPTDSELAERYQPLLVSKAAELRANSEQTSTDRRPVELDQQSVGRLSRMDAMQQQAMSAAQESRRRARMVAIDAALRRLAQGEFGWCSECGEFIGIERLDLDPTLMHCVDCAR